MRYRPAPTTTPNRALTIVWSRRYRVTRNAPSSSARVVEVTLPVPTRLMSRFRRSFRRASMNTHRTRTKSAVIRGSASGSIRSQRCAARDTRAGTRRTTSSSAPPFFSSPSATRAIMTSTRARGPPAPDCRATTFRRIDSVYLPSWVVRSSNCVTRTNPAPPMVPAASSITSASAGRRESRRSSHFIGEVRMNARTAAKATGSRKGRPRERIATTSAPAASFATSDRALVSEEGMPRSTVSAARSGPSPRRRSTTSFRGFPCALLFSSSGASGEARSRRQEDTAPPVPRPLDCNPPPSLGPEVRVHADGRSRARRERSREMSLPHGWARALR